MKILWCITGAGQFLPDVCEFIENSKLKITVAFSKAGLEVSQMYGVFSRIKKNSVDTILEETQGASFPVIGRLPKNEYDFVVVAPCTANTTAKIAYGIADSLVSNIVAQALKTRIPVYILPTDAEKMQKTRIPINIDIEKCRNCVPCKAMEKCPNSAFFVSDRVWLRQSLRHVSERLKPLSHIRVNLLKCNACRRCIEFCNYKAITFGKEITVHSRKIDMDNVRRINRVKGIRVIKNLRDLFSRDE